MPPAKKSRAMPKWQPAPAELTHIFEKAAAALPEAKTRKVFGYPAAFLQGQMFAGLHQDKMILRLSETDRADLLQQTGAKIFEPMPDRPMREYVVVPDSVVRSTKQLSAWIAKALAYARSLPPKAAKPGSRKAKV